jgi:hypothetical protein
LEGQETSEVFNFKKKIFFFFYLDNLIDFIQYVFVPSLTDVNLIMLEDANGIDSLFRSVYSESSEVNECSSFVMIF